MTDTETDMAVRQRWLDHNLLERAGEYQELDDADKPWLQNLRAEADTISARRQREYDEAMASGVTPCPANWARDLPCVNPAGDGHDGECYGVDTGGWHRSTSWFTPEAAAACKRYVGADTDEP